MISVIIATYYKDKVQFLDRAIDSIVNQTIKDWELIIVCDGVVSNETQDCLDNWITKDSRIKVLKLLVNSGPAMARNHGIANSNGEYVAILDADDIACKDRLEIQRQYLLQNKLDIVGSNYFEINAAGDILGEKKLPEFHSEIKRQATWHCTMANPTIFAKKNVFNDYAYEVNLRLGEDYRLWINLLIQGKKFGNVQLPLIYFTKENNFFVKRRGFKYAKSDLKTKWMARRLLPLWKWPMSLYMALLSFFVRLLPPILFKYAHDLKNKGHYKNG